MGTEACTRLHDRCPRLQQGARDVHLKRPSRCYHTLPLVRGICMLLCWLRLSSDDTQLLSGVRGLAPCAPPCRGQDATQVAAPSSLWGRR